MRKSNSRILTPLVAGMTLLMVVALVAACGGGGGGEGGNPTLASGEKHFMSTCATCHGRDGHGMPKLGKDLHDNGFTQGLSDDELVAFLIEGRAAWDPLNEQGVDMPPRGGNPALTDENLREIVAYLRTFS